MDQNIRVRVKVKVKVKVSVRFMVKVSMRQIRPWFDNTIQRTKPSVLCYPLWNACSGYSGQVAVVAEKEVNGNTGIYI